MELILILVPAFIHSWLMGNFSFTQTEEEMEKKPLAEGIRLFDEGRVAEAFRFFEGRSTQMNKSAWLHLYLGKCHFYFENVESALVSVDRALRLDSTLREAYLYKARCMYNLEDWNKAYNELKKASRMHQDRNPELLRLMADVDYRLGNFENAKKNLRIAFDLDGQEV